MEFNNDMVAMFNQAKKMAEELKQERISSSMILYLLLEKKGFIYNILSQLASDKEFMDLAFKEVMNYDDSEVISEFSEDNISESNQEWDEFIPKALGDTLREFDYKKELRIYAKSKDIDNVWNVFMKDMSNNVVLVGDENIGKSAIVDNIAHLINNNKCPEQFNGYHIVKWNLNSISIFAESGNDRIFEYLKKWLKDRNRVILVIDELPSVAKSSKMFSIILKYAIKLFLESGDNRLIVICNPDEYSSYFNKTDVMPKVFESINVETPKTSEVYLMIKKQIEYLQEKNKVRISRKNIELVIGIVNTLGDEKNLGKILRIIEKSIIDAKSNCRKRVSRQDIFKNSNLDIEALHNRTKEYTKQIAFHEAGHYIVGKKSKSVARNKPIMISIIPIPKYGYDGVTVFEKTDIELNTDKNWFIENIALNIAGRVAESYIGKISGLASADLDMATDMAEKMIMHYGMTDFTKNIVFSYEVCSDKMKEEIFELKEQIVQEAYNLAERILNENKDLLYKLVEELEKKLILNEKELNRIVKSVEKK